MTAPRFSPNWAKVDTSAAVWRGRAIRYVLIYLSLLLGLVTARYFTQDIRPNLRAALEREAQLVTQRDNLALEVQALETPQRIRDWAFANGMHRFAEAPKVTQAIKTAPHATDSAAQSAAALAPRTVQMRTLWK